MFQNIKFKNRKSVTFKVRSFAVPAKKQRMSKHTIYAAKNSGFIAGQRSLKSGFGAEHLTVNTDWIVPIPAPIISVSFAEDSWTMINAVACSGKASQYYKIGDEKTIKLGANEEITLQILGFNHDDLADGSGKAGITIGMKHLLATTYKMNGTSTNIGGWNASSMFTQTISELFAQLPIDLQSAIKSVNKFTTAGNLSTNLVTSQNNLFLFSRFELFGTTSATIEIPEGEQYEYWKQFSSISYPPRIKRLANGEGDASFWWTRSPTTNDLRFFGYVHTDGWQGSNSASALSGVCFGFCIGKTGEAVLPPIITTEIREITLRQIDATRIKKVFCFPTHQDGRIVNCIIATTQQGVYFVPLWAELTPRLIPNQNMNFDCFAYSYSGDRDFILAANENGIFVADNSLIFEPFSTSIRHAKQMIVFDKRLFVLDSNGETIYFTEGLNLLQVEGSIRVDQTLGKVMSFDIHENKLLVVCENGFKVLDSAFDSAKFKFSTLCRSYETIVDGSTKALGDTIYFLTKGGMCRAVGGKVELLDIDIVVDGKVTSMVHDNKYFLSSGTKMIVIEKFIDSVTAYENMGIRAFERIHNEFTDRLAVLTDTDGFIFQIGKTIQPNECVWESEDFALTYAAGNQYIRQVLIETKADIDLVVASNRQDLCIRVKGAEGIQQINLNLKGEVFRIKLVASGGSIQISSLSVVVGF